MNKKIYFVLFYTITNPFCLQVFSDWLDEALNNSDCKTVLEPFAGSNNIPAMLGERVESWSCYDIDPPKINNYKKATVNKLDTINNYPIGFDVVITNPPYLGKSAAKRRGIDCDNIINDDIYKDCLDVMLCNSKYVAAIIPETFIVSSYDKSRLISVISLTCKMFDDTACPVCLALFGPNTSDDYSIYRMNEFLGAYLQLKKYDVVSSSSVHWKFNDPEGIIGVRCIDNFNDSSSIYFDLGDNVIDGSKIKESSRTITRIGGLPKEISKDKFIEICNCTLKSYRENTHDVFMASFKCLRSDGLYRRRLDFKTIKNILNDAYNKLNTNKLF